MKGTDRKGETLAVAALRKAQTVRRHLDTGHGWMKVLPKVSQDKMLSHGVSQKCMLNEIHLIGGKRHRGQGGFGEQCGKSG